MNRPRPRGQRTLQKILPDFPMAVQRTHPRKRGADEDPGTRKYERNGRALYVKPCPVGGFYPEEGICRRQDPAEREGKREECGYRDQA